MIRIAVGVWHRIGTPESAMAKTVSGVDVKRQRQTWFGAPEACHEIAWGVNPR